MKNFFLSNNSWKEGVFDPNKLSVMLICVLTIVVLPVVTDSYGGSRAH